jgi:hypothetical protein
VIITRQQPGGKKHEQASTQRNGHAVDKTIADREEQQGCDKPGNPNDPPVRRQQSIHDTSPWDSPSIAYRQPVARQGQKARLDLLTDPRSERIPAASCDKVS